MNKLIRPILRNFGVIAAALLIVWCLRTAPNRDRANSAGTTPGFSTGTTLGSTSGDGWTNLVTVPTAVAGRFTDLFINNEGSAPGYFSLDSGTTALRLPAGSFVHLNNVAVSSTTIQIERVSGGTNLSSISAYGF